MGDIGSEALIDGLADSPSAGVVPRSVDLIFSELRNSSRTSMVFLTYVELYNNAFYDLLDGGGDARIEIRESKGRDGRGVHLHGAVRKQVTEADEVHGYVVKGNKIRSTAATAVNDRSSRSHAILTIEIETIKPSDAEGSEVKMGKLTLVDLAGSERVTMSNAEGEELAEATAINSSLAALGDVLNALSKYHKSQAKRIEKGGNGGEEGDGKRPFVPFVSASFFFLVCYILPPRAR